MKPGWKIISHHNTYDDLYEKSSVIFEFADDFWQLHVDRDKLLDVMNMPSYIVEDWLWVSRLPIDEKTIGYHIERTKADIKHQTKKHQALLKSLPTNVFNESSSEKHIVAAEETLAILLSIQRRIRIDKIIS